MPGAIASLNPRQVFDDNLRPAELLLRVYALLDCDPLHTEHEIIDAVRSCVGADAEESMLLLYNQLFVGVVRERANIAHSTFKKAMLDNLLRQTVVAACTALDAFLPALLRHNISTVLIAKGKEFMPPDKETRAFFGEITFNLGESVGLLSDPDPALFITNRILSSLKDRAAGNATALHAIGSLLGITDPWLNIGSRLSMPGNRLKEVLTETIKRRNLIVHLADRSKADPDGPIQDITFSWTKQAVDTISNVCIALDELVDKRMSEFKSMTATAA